MENETEEFPKSANKLFDWFIEVKDDLADDGKKYIRAKLKEIDNEYKKALKENSLLIVKTKAIKEFLTTKKDKMLEILKKIKKIRIVIIE